MILNNINSPIMITLDILSRQIAFFFFLNRVKECETAYSATARKMIITHTVIQISMKEMYETLGTSDLTLSNIAMRVSSEVKFIPTRAEMKRSEKQLIANSIVICS